MYPKENFIEDNLKLYDDTNLLHLEKIISTNSHKEVKYDSDYNTIKELNKNCFSKV